MNRNSGFISVGLLSKFGINDRVAKETVLENGHINGTYRIDLLGKNGPYSVILQSVNTFVFSEPTLIMQNIEKVTSHIRDRMIAAGINPERRVMEFFKTQSGDNYYIDEHGSFWRSYVFIDGARTYDFADTLDLLYRTGCAFGSFQRWLSDFPMRELYETIPNFHNTPLRLRQLEEAIASDPLGRVKEVTEEIAFFRDRKGVAAKLVNMLENGEIPLRVTHNDTKCNNVLIDLETHEDLCVIDLDTVMPGLAAFDFGDAVRFAASSVAEDETDLSKVYLDLNRFEAFARGFIGESSGFFTSAELASMPWGALVITIELASRFLADYIMGDKYFRIHRSGQNLDRARNQIHLAKSMESKFDLMCSLVERYVK